MPNGQFHGRHKGPAIRIKNPLSLAVELTITDGKGFATCRTLRPGAEVYVKVPHQGDYDIDPKILRYDHTGQPARLGDGGFEPTSTVVAKPKMAPQPGPILTAGQKEVKSRRWVTVAEWLITKGFAGLLRAISIQLDGDCEAQVIISGKKPTRVKQDTTLQYQNNTWLNKGEAVRVKARSHIGNKGTVHAMIQGELYPAWTAVPTGKVTKKAPEHVTETKPSKEPEEPPLRSLGEMIDEMKKREEVLA